MTRAMLIESHAPRKFWPEALATSTYLINRLPTSSLNLKTPLEALSTLTQVPTPLTLQPRVFGCSVFVHIPKHEWSKLSPCAIKCVFMGYGVNQKGYRCYDPKSNRMFTTMNCDFLETEYFFHHLSGQGESNENNNGDDPLSWLPISKPPTVDPPEEVVRTTEQVSTIQSIAPSDSPEDPSPISTVSPPAILGADNETVDIVSDLETNIEEQETIVDKEPVTTGHGAGEEPSTSGYILPPRSNRGVPPK